MDQINLQEGDLAEMRQFYREELAKALDRLQHIKVVLDKLGDNTHKIKISFTETTQVNKTKPITYKQEKTPTSPVKGKRGRKSVWDKLIINKLKEKNHPLTYQELAEALEKDSNSPMVKTATIRQAIMNVVSKSKREGKKLETVSSGSREKFVVLKSWTDEAGQLKSNFRPASSPVKQKPKTSSKVKQENLSRPKGKKSVEQPVWESYVLELLRLEGKPVSVETMTERAMKRFNISPKHYHKTRQAVTRSMSQLEKKENQVKPVISNGKRTGFYELG
ncbi:MAG TPA: hypothetical protein PK904_18275 [Bacteroidales bacterium]|nr:hypothetical protein [Bacteroidales bacterium]